VQGGPEEEAVRTMTELDVGTDEVEIEIDEGVATFTLNRPERRNALTQTMLDGLARGLAAVETDDDVGAVVLTGAGGAFCSGGDVKAMAATNETRAGGGRGSSLDARIHRQRLNQRATSVKLWEMPKPTIAAIPGPAAGAGLSLALACDLRYAVEGAFLTTAFARVALSGDYGGTWFLSRLVGTAKARELYYFSERVSADEALSLGLVNAVFGAAVFEAEVTARARRLAAGPRTTYRYMKENLNRAVHGDLAEASDLEVTHHIHSGLTEDHREAAQAFVEKREPKFGGR
jgi:2-(1,2-epoxy-1,2-dihydrophenyl)acetyl-CoA isomerase